MGNSLQRKVDDSKLTAAQSLEEKKDDTDPRAKQELQDPAAKLPEVLLQNDPEPQSRSTRIQGQAEKADVSAGRQIVAS